MKNTQNNMSKRMVDNVIDNLITFLQKIEISSEKDSSIVEVSLRDLKTYIDKTLNKNESWLSN